MNPDNYTAVLLEEIRDQMKAVLEIVADNQTKVSKLDGIERNVSELKDDMKIVKQAVTDTSKDLKLLERRVTKLEQSV